MQVTHHEDYNTHAILGGGEAETFGIENNAQFVTMLSSTIYTNGYLAVAREVLCNAWDAHKIVNKRDLAIKVDIDEDFLTIRDFGPGIPHNKLVSTCFKYGGTTKLMDENQTGGFGLGAKSPFAYTDHFTQTNYHGGFMVVWAVSRGNKATKGMPDARPIVNVPSDETGMEVKIPIKKPEDVKIFMKAIEDIAYFGGMNVELNGKHVHTFNWEELPEQFLITQKAPPSVNGNLYVRYGDVIYPMPEDESYEEQFRIVKEFISNGNGKQSNWGGWSGAIKEFYCIFLAPPHSISPTPSRESIHKSEHSVETILELLNNFIYRMNAVDVDSIVVEKERDIMETLIADPKYNNRDLIFEDNLIKAYLSKEEGWKDKTQGYVFSSVQNFTVFQVAHGSYTTDYGERDFAKMEARLARVIKAGCNDLDLLVKLFKRCGTNDDGEFSPDVNAKYFNGLIPRAMAFGIDYERIRLWDKNQYRGRNRYPTLEAYKDAICYSDDLLDLTNRVMYYATAKSQLDEKDRWFRRNFPEMYQSFMTIVHLEKGTKKTDHDAQIMFYRKQGYIVIDCRPPAVAKSLVPAERRFVPAAPRAPSVKYKGWPTLANTQGSYEPSMTTFNNTHAEDMKRSTKPLFVHRPHSNVKNNRKIFRWNDSEVFLMVKYFGDDGVIAKTEAQYSSIQAKTKAEDAYNYIIDKVCSYIENCPAYEQVARENHAYENFWINWGDLKTLRDKVKGFGHIVLPELELSDEQKHYKTMFGIISKDIHRVITTHRQRVHDLAAKMDQFVDPDAVNPFNAFFGPKAADNLTFIRFANVLNKAAFSKDGVDSAKATMILQTALL